MITVKNIAIIMMAISLYINTIIATNNQANDYIDVFILNDNQHEQFINSYDISELNYNNDEKFTIHKIDNEIFVNYDNEYHHYNANNNNYYNANNNNYYGDIVFSDKYSDTYSLNSDIFYIGTKNFFDIIDNKYIENSINSYNYSKSNNYSEIIHYKCIISVNPICIYIQGEHNNYVLCHVLLAGGNFQTNHLCTPESMVIVSADEYKEITKCKTYSQNIYLDDIVLSDNILKKGQVFFSFDEYCTDLGFNVTYDSNVVTLIKDNSIIHLTIENDIIRYNSDDLKNLPIINSNYYYFEKLRTKELIPKIDFNGKIYVKLG